MEDEQRRSGMMTREEWMAWLRETWDKAQARAHTPDDVEKIKSRWGPVAYVTGFHNGHCVIQPIDPAVVLPVGLALYRAPTEWVGLTAYEIQEIHSGNQHWGNFACAIEAKLKEKNHG